MHYITLQYCNQTYSENFGTISAESVGAGGLLWCPLMGPDQDLVGTRRQSSRIPGSSKDSVLWNYLLLIKIYPPQPVMKVIQCIFTYASLKLVSAIFYRIFIFYQIIALQKLWKMFFVSSQKLFSFSRYSNFRLPLFVTLAAIALEVDPRKILKFMTPSTVKIRT